MHLAKEVESLFMVSLVRVRAQLFSERDQFSAVRRVRGGHEDRASRC